MEELLKEVQEIYTFSEFKTFYNEHGEEEESGDSLIISRRGRLDLTLSLFKGTYFLSATGRSICSSKDENKILAVLKAIKECNDE